MRAFVEVDVVPGARRCPNVQIRDWIILSFGSATLEFDGLQNGAA
jgi:hypothetical protein